MQDALLRNGHFAQQLTADPGALPLSFRYGGQLLHGIPASWRPQRRLETLDSCRQRVTLSGSDPASGLRLSFELTNYRDHPVCEWVLWLENAGSEDTLPISELMGADLTLPMAAGAPWRLWSGVAESHDDKNYSFSTTALAQGDDLHFTNRGGRPSDGAFPYFRLLGDDGGYALAIGWPGQWQCHYDIGADGVQWRAGQGELACVLRPGERIRTPRLTVMSFAAADDPVNCWRAWYRAHILPRAADGQPLQPRLCGYARRGADIEHCSETCDTQLAFIREARAKGFHFHSWWIDAGWYPCTLPPEKRTASPWMADKPTHWVYTGDWRPDPARFPQGLKPIADELASENAELLLWFEPERIFAGLGTDGMPDDWWIKLPGNVNSLLNLGNNDCRQALTDKINRQIRDNGIRVYRQDFNFDPLPYWRQVDAAQGPQRQGVCENLYIQGYLAYWDALLAANPGLWIDSCSSGGRRNDLETMRRAVPLHYSDYGYELYVDKQRYHHVLYQWLMYFKDAQKFCLQNKDRAVDDFAATASMAPMTLLPLCFPADFATDSMLAIAERWSQLRPFFVDGDYYLLSEELFGDDRWLARQFHDSAWQAGAVILLRNEHASDASFQLRLRGLDPDRDYVLSDLRDGRQHSASGRRFSKEGMAIALPQRGATVLHYHAL